MALFGLLTWLPALIVLAALALDAWLGEPRRWHPLVGFGRLTLWLENHWHTHSRLRGLFSVAALLLPFTLFTLLIMAWSKPLWLNALLEIFFLYLVIGWRSLGQHAQAVYQALANNDLPRARQRVGWIVSRDTSELNPNDIAKATIESVLENGNDAIFATLFWFIVAGAPGAVLYRLSNTLDAMWGYRNARYQTFGWAAARLDDALNWIPARLTALSYALVGQTHNALLCWKTQGHRWKSPNAGPVMAAGAGSLALQLGGAAVYHGKTHTRLVLGLGSTATLEDIPRALRLIRRALMLWVMALFFFCVIF